MHQIVCGAFTRSNSHPMSTAELLSTYGLQAVKHTSLATWHPDVTSLWLAGRLAARVQPLRVQTANAHVSPNQGSQ